MQSSNQNDQHKSPPPSAPPPELGQFAPPLPPPQFVQYYAPPPPAAPPQFVQYAPPPPPLQQQQPYGQYAITGLPLHSTSTLAPWSTGLCDCCSDVPNCCLTCWCPCITFGQIAEIVDKGSTSCGVHGVLYALINLTSGCGCVYSCIYRSKMRRQYLLPESPCNDCLVHSFCQSCALCQEYRELQHRGFDISIGRQPPKASHLPGVFGSLPDEEDGQAQATKKAESEYPDEGASPQILVGVDLAGASPQILTDFTFFAVSEGISGSPEMEFGRFDMEGSSVARSW